MFAVIRTGGKQYRVAPNDVIVIERVAGEPGATVELGEVLMLGDGAAEARIGTPLVDKAAVFAEVLEQARTSKINVFKKTRRKKYRRTHGHRQNVTVLRITEIAAAGVRTAARKAEPAPKTEAKADAAPKAKAAPKRKAAPKTKAEAKPPPKTEANAEVATKAKAAPKREAAPKSEAAPAKGGDKAAAGKAPPAKRRGRAPAKPPAAKGKTEE